MVRVAINGFGRIGRGVVRAWWQREQEAIQIVAINTSGSMELAGWAHLLCRDSVYGRFPGKIETLPPQKGGEIGRLKINESEIPVLAERNPARIPWRRYQAEIILECTGVFLDQKARAHLKGGAQKVILSAPPKDEHIPVYLLGVNADKYRGEEVLSNGSCTTNAVAPILRLIDQKLGFEQCLATTVHSYTASQNLVDGSHPDLRRARAAAINIIPTGTGATAAVIKAYPEAQGRFSASAIRVPTLCGSFAELVFKLRRKTTIDEINQILIEAAGGELAGFLGVSWEPLVSSDIIGNPASGIVDLPLTQVIGDDLLYLGVWYDNEYGYCCRLLELAKFIAQN